MTNEELLEALDYCTHCEGGCEGCPADDECMGRRHIMRICQERLGLANKSDDLKTPDETQTAKMEVLKHETGTMHNGLLHRVPELSAVPGMRF